MGYGVLQPSVPQRITYRGACPITDAPHDTIDGIASIVARMSEMGIDELRAMIWFRKQPLAGFGNHTAEQLVDAGHAAAVLWALESIDQGVYA